MAASPNLAIVDAVAHAISYGPNLNAPTKEDVEILEELVKRTEPRVLVSTFVGLARLGNVPKLEASALERTTQIALTDEPKLAEEYCDMFGARGLNADALKRSRLQQILEKLEAVRELPEYGVASFLNRISGSDPDLLIDFVVKRLERYRELKAGDETTDYEPFPLRGMHFRDLRLTPKYAGAMKRLRDLVLEYPRDWLWTIPLFWAAGTVDATTFAVLDEWVHSGDESKLAGLLRLLAEAPRGLVVSHPFFAIHLVDEYGRVGHEWEREMIAQLARNSLSLGFGYVHQEAGIPSPFGQAHEKAAELIKYFPADSPAYRLFAELVANKENWTSSPPIEHAVEIEEWLE
jgi:hypothetical protein